MVRLDRPACTGTRGVVHLSGELRPQELVAAAGVEVLAAALV